MIEINNLTDQKLKFSDIKNFFQRAIKTLKIKKSISLVFVDSQLIKKLNKIYRQKNKETDVLSFSNFVQEPKGRVRTKLRTHRIRKKACLRRQVVNPNKILEKNFPNVDDYLGEIVISLSVAKRQAFQLKHSLEKEIKILFVHSLFHLLGYDHQNKKAASLMFEKEIKLLNTLEK